MPTPSRLHLISTLSLALAGVTDAWKGAQNSLVTVLGLVGVQGVTQPLLEKRQARTR